MWRESYTPPLIQTTNDNESRIRYLEEVVHRLLIGKNSSMPSLISSAPRSASFRYSKNRGLIPILSEATAKSLPIAQSKQHMSSYLNQTSTLSTDRRPPLSNFAFSLASSLQESDKNPLFQSHSSKRCPSSNRSMSLQPKRGHAETRVKNSNRKVNKAKNETEDHQSPRFKLDLTCRTLSLSRTSAIPLSSLSPTIRPSPELQKSNSPVQSISLDRFPSFDRLTSLDLRLNANPEILPPTTSNPSQPSSSSVDILADLKVAHGQLPFIKPGPPDLDADPNSHVFKPLSSYINHPATSPADSGRTVDTVKQRNSDCATHSPPTVPDSTRPHLTSGIVLSQLGSPTSPPPVIPDKQLSLTVESLPRSSGQPKDTPTSPNGCVKNATTSAHPSANAIGIQPCNYLPSSSATNTLTITTLTSSPNDTSTNNIAETLPTPSAPSPACSTCPLTALAYLEKFDVAEGGAITVMEYSDYSSNSLLAPDLSQAAVEHYDDIDNYLKTLNSDEKKNKKKKKKKKKTSHPTSTCDNPVPNTTSTPENPVLFYV
ncbi:hypothetical protein Pst134EA_002931 [Puccinia striiformis f. sp. tritici]|uniref:Uncharacterized protein n=2 Tax=Puccinia striiformis TaxID=27350 RepID=A0A2S4UFF8_9BASI|nr:hypothetical protein Pst134EA_002931 [Puccinia striiformis f. sp. tritici]KAH9472308.1 hypothetical protein Pst134EA_002931 [Puccinia striiformis f. sp. tritici]POV96022.1 hypothetical protein PSTT_15868 [Puccinia striiformis]